MIGSHQTYVWTGRFVPCVFNKNIVFVCCFVFFCRGFRIRGPLNEKRTKDKPTSQNVCLVTTDMTAALTAERGQGTG